MRSGFEPLEISPAMMEELKKNQSLKISCLINQDVGREHVSSVHQLQSAGVGDSVPIRHQHPTHHQADLGEKQFSNSSDFSDHSFRILAGQLEQ